MTISRKSETELVLETYLTELGIYWRAEVQFAPPRKWRFDYYVWKCNNGRQGVGIEIEGGGWVAGRHTRGKGFENDLEKYATATAMGITVFRFSPEQIKTGRAKDFLKRWLEVR